MTDDVLTPRAGRVPDAHVVFLVTIPVGAIGRLGEAVWVSPMDRSRRTRSVVHPGQVPVGGRAVLEGRMGHVVDVLCIYQALSCVDPAVQNGEADAGHVE